MKVIEHLKTATRPLISFEIIPPLRGGNLKKLMKLVEDLAEHRPPFIDITSHAAEIVFEEMRGGYQRRIKRKRPGTLGVCALIQNKYRIDAVPHVLCQGFTRQETEDFLIELRYLGIDNVLAIRGDDSGYVKELKEGRTRNVHASELVAQVSAMNRGDYLEDMLDADPTEFCVGVAGYPEKHFESPNLQTDIRWVKKKVEAGAEYVVTQMFFNNEHYFRYVDACREAGITVPIIPGIKLLTTPRHLTSIPRTFHCEIPEALASEAAKAPDGKVRPVGVEWGLMQARELLDKGVPSVHFYVMSSTTAINELLAQLDV